MRRVVLSFTLSLTIPAKRSTSSRRTSRDLIFIKNKKNLNRFFLFKIRFDGVHMSAAPRSSPFGNAEKGKEMDAKCTVSFLRKRCGGFARASSERILKNSSHPRRSMRFTRPHAHPHSLSGAGVKTTRALTPTPAPISLLRIRRFRPIPPPPPTPRPAPRSACFVVDCHREWPTRTRTQLDLRLLFEHCIPLNHTYVALLIFAPFVSAGTEEEKRAIRGRDGGSSVRTVARGSGLRACSASG